MSTWHLIGVNLLALQDTHTVLANNISKETCHFPACLVSFSLMLHWCHDPRWDLLFQVYNVDNCGRGDNSVVGAVHNSKQWKGNHFNTNHLLRCRKCKHCTPSWCLGVNLNNCFHSNIKYPSFGILDLLSMNNFFLISRLIIRCYFPHSKWVVIFPLPSPSHCLPRITRDLYPVKVKVWQHYLTYLGDVDSLEASFPDSGDAVVGDMAGGPFTCWDCGWDSAKPLGCVLMRLDPLASLMTSSS